MNGFFVHQEVSPSIIYGQNLYFKAHAIWKHIDVIAVWKACMMTTMGLANQTALDLNEPNQKANE